LVPAETAAASVDAPSATAFEQHGIDTIPDEERRYSPWHIFWVLFASDLCFSVIVVGWLPIIYGLGWWSAVSSIVVGSVVGGLVLSPMGLFGPRTGTNNPVSSGAHFGVGGRLLGTILGLFSAFGFIAITIWTGGDALTAGFHKLFGTPYSDGIRAIGYAVITLVVVAIAVRGIHLLLRVQQRIMAPIMGLVLIIGIFAFAPHFHAGYHGGTYLLGTFWPTWTLSALTSASTVISYAPFIGDWARYISPKRHSERSVVIATGIGGAVGIGIPALWGAFAASTFGPKQTGVFIPDLVTASPTWYVVGIVLVGLVAGCAQGAVGLYGTGLDTSSLIPPLSRPQATLAIAAVAAAFVYIGNFVWNASATVSAFLIVLVVITTPWLVICAIGYWWRRGWYDTDALQVFTRGQRGGRYWFTGGINWRAFAAWVPAAVVGSLFAAAPPLFTGPFASAANGIDLSFGSAGVTGGLIYLIVLVLFPESPEVFAPGQARGKLGHSVASSDVAVGPEDPAEALVSTEAGR
jgi:purine-cytosine permease-like protein